MIIAIPDYMTATPLCYLLYLFPKLAKQWGGYLITDQLCNAAEVLRFRVCLFDNAY
jgi:hypothetical protein